MDKPGRPLNKEEMIEFQRKRQDAQNQRLSLQSLQAERAKGDVKNCPTCGSAIEKTAGCNKMDCGNCHTKFCWLCEEIIDGYDHFRLPEDGGEAKGCTGKLF